MCDFESGEHPELFSQATLDALTADIPRLPCDPDPAAGTEQSPVVRIQYSPGFRSTFGAFRGLQEHSPRAMALLAVALKTCMAHYSVWKRRRDVVLAPAAFAASCHRHAFCHEAWQPSPGMSPTQEPEPPMFAALDSRLLSRQPPHAEPAATALSDTERMAAAWSPSAAALLAYGAPAAPYQTAVTVDGAPRVHDPWVAVAWELRMMRWAAVSTGKSFQTWNHRKELLLSAASVTTSAMPPGQPCPMDGTVSRWPWLTFAAFDERVLCDHVLRHRDSKNYHAWAHRAWFLLFAGLLDAPAELDRELDFCTRLVAADVFNNSAWSHRMLVTRHRLVARCRTAEAALPRNVLPAPFPVASALNPRDPSAAAAAVNMARAERTRWAQGGVPAEAAAVLREELRYAAARASVEPRNESPFTFMVGLAGFVEEVAVGPVAYRRRREVGALLPTDPAEWHDAPGEGIATVAAFTADVVAALDEVGRHTDATEWPEAEEAPPLPADSTEEEEEEEEHGPAAGYAAAAARTVAGTPLQYHRRYAEFRLRLALARAARPTHPDVARTELTAAAELCRRIAAEDPCRHKLWALELADIDAALAALPQ